MLIVANGPFKSGSTWLYDILRELVPDACRLPVELRDPTWGTVDTPRPDAWRETAALARDHDVVVKSHERPWILTRVLQGHGDIIIRFVSIDRDPVAVFESARRHYTYLGFGPLSPDAFFRSQGRFVLDMVRRHNQAFAHGKASGIVLSYERLEDDFASEVYRLSTYLGIPADRVSVARTTRSQMRARYADTGMAGMSAAAFFGGTGLHDGPTPELVSDIRFVATRGLPLWRRVEGALRHRLRAPWREELRWWMQAPTGLA